MASQIAAQLYTLREYTKTQADIASTLKKVRKIGYEAVQTSALGPIDPKELARILKGEGLTCCATHVSPDRMRAEPQAVIDEHKLWGCDLIAIGGFWPKEPSAAAFRDFATDYNTIAKPFTAAGQSIGYHNHAHELAAYDGKRPLDILLETLDKSIWFEIDTYWIAFGGGDPIQWINKVKGRIPAIHLKDMRFNAAEKKQFMAEVGEGNLNWPGILQAAKAAGCKWFIVEQDICYRDPFDSLELSLKNLRALGLN